jgi:1,2-diacylglycerol 3-beta-glucosyltransferase
MGWLTPASVVALGVVAGPLAYLYALALAAIRSPGAPAIARPRHRFAIAIAAHNEESVIADTVSALLRLEYPRDLFDVHVVADHCSDHTVELARAAGAEVHERRDEAGRGKGAALRWLFARLLEHQTYDAVVVFDADTQPQPDFLRAMDARLGQGDQVIQGQHRIRNPDDGWFPALVWAMFIVDNRLQNLGRANLGWSAKNMGDSICLRADVLRRFGWGGGLTEDYAFRQELLLAGIRISYEPSAVGLGEAPQTWAAGRAQRARWLRGTRDASRQYGRRLLEQAIRRRSMPLIDGALQAHLPAYSSMTVVTAVVWLMQALLLLTGRVPFDRSARGLLGTWSCVGGALLAYPLLGLVLEHAPMRAYLAILSGPPFIVWRTWLAILSRRGGTQVAWVRTPRRQDTVR